MCEHCETLLEALDIVLASGIRDDALESKTLAEVEQCEIKTQAYYEKAMRRVITQYYHEKISDDGFLEGMITLVEDQFGRAFREGLRLGGVDPLTEMTAEWRAALAARVRQEFEYIIPLAEAIQRGRESPAALPALQMRAALWANRYPEIVDWALSLVYDGNLEWQLGRTEQHCPTCAALNGIVAHRDEWEIAKVRPQNAPNPLLECGGWRCDCRLVPVKKRKTPKALTLILDIVILKSFPSFGGKR